MFWGVGLFGVLKGFRAVDKWLRLPLGLQWLFFFFLGGGGGGGARP